MYDKIASRGVLQGADADKSHAPRARKQFCFSSTSTTEHTFNLSDQKFISSQGVCFIETLFGIIRGLLKFSIGEESF